MRVALIHKHFRPYHAAQARALMARSSLQVRCIELKDGEGGYQPTPERDRPEGLVTLCSHRDHAGLRRVSERLIRELEAWDPDVVVVAGYNTAALRRAVQWARAHGKASMLMLSVTGRWTWLDGFLAPAKSWFIRRHFDTAFVGGMLHAEYLAALGFPRGRVWQGYEAVDNDVIAARVAAVRRESARWRRQLDLPPAYLLYVGRLNRHKNLRELLHAFQRYRAMGSSGWRLIMVGDGPDEQALRAEAARLGLGDALVWAGRRSGQELSAYFALAGGVILPSMNETWGLTVNEAMASGVPVLVSRRCGCVPELVQDGINGCLFAPGDAEALAATLARFTSQPPAALAAMSEASRRLIATYSLERWAQEFEGAVSAAAELQQRHSRTQADLVFLGRYVAYFGYKAIRRILRGLGLSFVARRVAGRWLAGLLFALAKLRHPDGVFLVEGHQMVLAPPHRYPPIDMLMDRYEPPTTWLFKRLLRPGMTMIDGGAHVGYYTLLAARAVGPSGRVYAFEPEPQNNMLLRENVRRNGYGHVTVLPRALWSGPARIPLFLSRLDNGSHSLRHRLVSGRTETVVEGVALDAFLAEQGWPRVDVIKLDVEGAEVEVLRGMQELIRRQPNLQLVVEFAPRLLQASGVNPADFLALLRRMSFQPAVVSDRGCFALEIRHEESLIRQLYREAGYVNLLCTADAASPPALRDVLAEVA